ncbi:group III truncated hemoglobin [Robiginitomaculum antarcticum]|uniref:group III truncated hemoglobin n=1 Tax=Robiginitomaculum antarcticum TaxID=437507 RepID=UPI00036607AE|nr:group III truncated hemoglobin [Robiginitomaculum antarcticum]
MALRESDIQNLMTQFYAAVRRDPLLAPVFASRIQGPAWPAHEAHIADFWSSVMLKTGRFKGNPMMKHLALSGLTPAHFTRWLALFKSTADDTLSPKDADAIHTMANRIAQSFQMGLAFHHTKTQSGQNPFEDFSVTRPSI